MKLLAFDTSSATVSLALCQDGVIKAQKLIAPDAQNRQESITLLVPGIEELTKSLDWKPEDLDFIVVGTGPGSFTGLRIGVVTARSMAQALEIGVLSLTTFDCLESLVEEPAGFVLDGGRGHYFVSTPDTEPLVMSENQLNEMISSQKLIWHHFKPENIKADQNLKPLPESKNMAASLASIAFKNMDIQNKSRSELKNAFPYKNIKPLYLREASVTLKKNPTHARKP